MRHFLLIAFIFLSLQAFSQKMTISGDVQDTALKIPMKNVVAMAVRIKDSVLVAHTRTNEKGFFTLANLTIDTVQVIVSDSKFSEQSYYVFGSAANYAFDFGKIILPAKSQQLGEVIIYAYKDPVYYKGDTLIYTADSFKVKPNATVEDLLRKLPGIKVDAQGKITSQGKDISQVLVDGDEFFGSDPTVATKNLAAQGVESVQVYEKKNENAGDGQEETTQVMNLKLKEDAKKGYFGKVSGASDFQNFYEGELLANKFKKSLKISVFALASNTPRSSFGWGDMYKFGLDNDNMQTDEDGGMFWNGQGNVNKGVPQTLKSGFYYTDKIGKKTKLGLNYTYTNNQLDAVGSSRSQYFLSDTTGYITDNSSRNIQRTEGHAVSFKITQTLDSLTELEFEPKIKLNSTKQDNFSSTSFLTDADTLTRQTNVRNTNNASGYDINTNIKLKRSFKNRDRQFRMNYNVILVDNKSDGILKADNTYYNATTPTSDSIIDQKKSNTSKSQSHNGNIVYTEPLSKKIKLEFEYNFSYNISKQSKISQNYTNGEYTGYDSTLTNDFENVKMINRLGVKFIHETKKQAFNFGARVRNVDVENTNIITNQVFTQSVNNILPFIGYMYRFSENSRLNIKYSTSSAQPSLNQLQPVPDNSNPNQIKLGNPNLVPTFVNKFDISYNVYKPISGKYLWMSGNFQNTDNAFANSIAFDSLGRTVSQTLNVNGNYNARAGINGGLPFFSKKLQVSPNVGCSYNSNSNFINLQKNITSTLSANAGLAFEVNLDTLSFELAYTIDYSDPSSTLSTASNKPYYSQNFNATFRFRLPFKIFLETDAAYVINSQRAEGYNLNYVVWNASINKFFLKNENLILTVSGNDILNQNVMNNRTVQDNVIIDDRTSIISRYFLLKLTYKFNSTKTKETDDYF